MKIWISSFDKLDYMANEALHSHWKQLAVAPFR